MNTILRKSLQLALAALLFHSSATRAQTPASYNAADILQQLEKLKTVGSVLYIAAHPDDENTRLLAYLANEKKYRTGYLSLTRGDGGQNLIGDEQGIDLGVIRTQELLAARRTDGAEQFFTSAYDFGFSKNPDETFRFWNKEQVLSDVVFVIRKFQPDIIITRFPTTGEGGHGHHTASAILAQEAFDMAGDPSRFPEQLKLVKPWSPKRLLWNTFNFGSANTIRDDQFQVEVGQYNPYLGKSYGEIASESRSQHKSQGFGVAANRGESREYFNPQKGPRPEKDLLEGVTTNWSRFPGTADIGAAIDSIISAYDPKNPERIVPVLAELHKRIRTDNNIEPTWKIAKLKEIGEIVKAAAGLWLSATTAQPTVVSGEELPVLISINKRLPAQILLNRFSTWTNGEDSVKRMELPTNRNVQLNRNLSVNESAEHNTQPYWLRKPMKPGYFDIQKLEDVGRPENPPLITVEIELDVNGELFNYSIPVQYRFTDPVKGEIYQPIQLVPAVEVKTSPEIMLFSKGKTTTQQMEIVVTANRPFEAGKLKVVTTAGNQIRFTTTVKEALAKGQSVRLTESISNATLANGPIAAAKTVVEVDGQRFDRDKRTIQYDHIPVQHYFYHDSVRLINVDLKTAGKKVGYIPGAGDKVPQALQQMGYEVTMLNEDDITVENLKKFDAVITGVRAHNIHSFLQNRYNILMNYIREGGNLVVQYNTNNQIGPVKANIAPYPFTITRNRVTDETAEPIFLKKDHRVFTYPNLISKTDFDGWIQERGIYFADQLAPEYETVLAFADPGEKPHNGSLIIAQYGKGTFVYTGLVFFRQLPAGVPGAYRLLANIIALNQKKTN